MPTTSKIHFSPPSPCCQCPHLSDDCEAKTSITSSHLVFSLTCLKAFQPYANYHKIQSVICVCDLGWPLSYSLALFCISRWLLLLPGTRQPASFLGLSYLVPFPSISGGFLLFVTMQIVSGCLELPHWPDILRTTLSYILMTVLSTGLYGF